MDGKERNKVKKKECIEGFDEMSLRRNYTFEEEKTMKSHGDHEEEVAAETQKGGHVMQYVKQENNRNMKLSSPNAKDLAIDSQEDQLKSAKAKVGKVREENEKLKLLLAQTVTEYQSLQTHFWDILQKEDKKLTPDTSSTLEETEERELVSLSLGRTISNEPKKDEKNRNLINGKQDKILNEGLELGVDCRFRFDSTESEKKLSSESSFEEAMKEEEPTEIWPPSKVFKTMRSEDEEDLQPNHLKKARVSVRARCDTPTYIQSSFKSHWMNDGCQWRKYGQKIAKGNPCPRAYYRCTVSPTCPVRKQVQRWVEDMSILITTYEGKHNHPLPLSATAMASTTSAAASMLQCRSLTSQVPTLNSTSSLANLHGLSNSFSFPHNSGPCQLYFPNSSISTNNSHPTVVLDLTAPAASSHLNRLSSAPRFPSTYLNFSNPSSANFAEPITNTLQRNSGYSNYGTLSYNKNHFGSLNLGKQLPQELIYQPASLNNHLTSQKSLTDVIANPNFQQALTAAITNYIGNGDSKAYQNQSGVANSTGLNLKCESFPVNNGSGCASSLFLNKLMSSNSQQQGSTSTFSPRPSFSTSKSASGSPAEHNKDHFKC